MSRDMPKSDMRTFSRAPTKQLRVARSLWTKLRDERYFIPAEIWVAIPSNIDTLNEKKNSISITQFNPLSQVVGHWSVTEYNLLKYSSYDEFGLFPLLPEE